VRLRVQGLTGFGASSPAGPFTLQFGERIRTLAYLRQPHVYQNPGTFDYRRWMEDIEDTYWTGTVKNPMLVERLGGPPRLSLAACLAHARRRLLDGIDDLYPPWSAQGRYGAVLKAVLWGDRTSLDSDTIEDFRKTGLYHLLVIAGLHVGLLTMLWGFLLRRLSWSSTVRSLVLLALLAGYALLVEQRAPTLRATLMIALYLVARIIDRDHSALNAIGGVALVLLYIRPPWLFESGFQLSFAAALLIVGLAVPLLARTTEPYRRALHRLDDVLLDDRFSPRLAQARLDLRALVGGLRWRFGILERYPGLTRNAVVAPARLLVWTVNIVVFSAILQLGLLLPVVETFHRVTFAGVGLNALAIPVMTLLLALALPINVLSVFTPGTAMWGARILSPLMGLLFGLTHLPGLAAWLSYRVPAPPAWVAWGYGAAFVLAAWTVRFARRAAGAALVVAGLFVALVAIDPFAPRLPRGTLELTALDCGPGDALFLVLPDQTTMLVDAGGGHARRAREGASQARRWDPGEDIVSPYLWSRGIKKVDILVLSHIHDGQRGGLDAVLDNFQVGEFWHARNRDTPEYEALWKKLSNRGIPARTLDDGEAISRGEALIEVWGPKRREPLAGLPVGDDPVAMQISARGMSFLLPGSAGRNTEKQLLASGSPLASQMIEVAYHGSRSSSSSELLGRVAPRVAILSAGTGSISKSPNRGSLRLLRNAGVRVFETSIDGAVTVEVKDGSLSVETYAASR
jgi:competence protein ComEC